MQQNKNIGGFSHKQIGYFYIAAVVLVIGVIATALILRHQNRLAATSSFASETGLPAPDDFNVTCPDSQTMGGNPGGGIIGAVFPVILTPGSGYSSRLQVYITSLTGLSGTYDNFTVLLSANPQTVNLRVTPLPPTVFGTYPMRITIRELTPAPKIFGKTKTCDTQLIIAQAPTSSTLTIIGGPSTPLAAGATWQFPQPQYDPDGAGPQPAVPVQAVWSIVPTPVPAYVSIDQNGVLRVLRATNLPVTETIKATYQGTEARRAVIIAATNGNGDQTNCNGTLLLLCGPTIPDADGKFTVTGTMTDGQKADRIVIWDNNQRLAPRCNAAVTCPYTGYYHQGWPNVIQMVAHRQGKPVGSATITIPKQ